LDEKYGHAVFLCPQGDIDGSLPVDVSLWDQVADWLTTKEESGPDRSGKIQIVRISKTKVRPGALCLLYIVHPTAQILSSAIVAGFFCFGTDFKWPGKALQSRGLLSIELAGEFREPRGEEPGGRVILHRLEDLVVGRKTVRAVTDYPAPDELKATSSRRMYRLRVADDFYKVWEQCVAAHGIDWMGFDTVRDAYAGLNQLGDSEGRPRLICIELVDIATGDVASGEVGVITGQCYTCLSLFADVDRFPRCDRVRQAASILWLARAGVVVFDVGITAEYFVQLSGFHRATREEFLSLWRRHRFVPHDRALIYQPCSTIYSLLAPRCKDRDVPAPVVPEPTPSAAKPVVRVVWSAPCADATEHGVTASFPAGCVDKVRHCFHQLNDDRSRSLREGRPRSPLYTLWTWRRNSV